MKIIHGEYLLSYNANNYLELVNFLKNLNVVIHSNLDFKECNYLHIKNADSAAFDFIKTSPLVN